MQRYHDTWMLLVLLVVGQTAVSVARADIVVPGESVPMVVGEVFGWTPSAPNSTFAFWDTFADFPGGSTPGFLPAGTSPAANTSFTGGGSSSLLTFQSNQSLTGGGNAYGGTFGGPEDPTFRTDAFVTVRSGTSGGDFTRIVAQFQTLGTELDYSSIRLSPSVGTPGTIAPSLQIETARVPFGGSFGGENVTYLALWDLDSAQAEYRFDFRAQGNNMSLDRFRIDTFTQSTAFVTPTAVPEPGSLAVLGLAGCAGVWHRRRPRRG